MASPGSRGSGEQPGLLHSIRLLIGSFVGYSSARLELLGLESREAAANYVRALLLAVIALLGIVFGYLFLVLSLAFLVQAWTGWNWVSVTTVFGITHLLGTVVCALGIKRRVSQPALTETLAEFRKDQDWLSRELPAPTSPRQP